MNRSSTKEIEVVAEKRSSESAGLKEKRNRKKPWTEQRVMNWLMDKCDSFMENNARELNLEGRRMYELQEDGSVVFLLPELALLGAKDNDYAVQVVREYGLREAVGWPGTMSQRMPSVNKIRNFPDLTWSNNTIVRQIVEWLKTGEDVLDTIFVPEETTTDVYKWDTVEMQPMMAENAGPFAIQETLGFQQKQTIHGLEMKGTLAVMDLHWPFRDPDAMAVVAEGMKQSMELAHYYSKCEKLNGYHDYRIIQEIQANRYAPRREPFTNYMNHYNACFDIVEKVPNALDVLKIQATEQMAYQSKEPTTWIGTPETMHKLLHIGWRTEYFHSGIKTLPAGTVVKESWSDAGGQKYAGVQAIIPTTGGFVYPWHRVTETGEYFVLASDRARFGDDPPAIMVKAPWLPNGTVFTMEKCLDECGIFDANGNLKQTFVDKLPAEIRSINLEGWYEKFVDRAELTAAIRKATKDPSATITFAQAPAQAPSSSSSAVKGKEREDVNNGMFMGLQEVDEDDLPDDYDPDVLRETVASGRVGFEITGEDTDVKTQIKALMESTPKKERLLALAALGIPLPVKFAISYPYIQQIMSNLIVVAGNLGVFAYHAPLASMSEDATKQSLATSMTQKFAAVIEAGKENRLLNFKHACRYKYLRGMNDKPLEVDETRHTHLTPEEGNAGTYAVIAVPANEQLPVHFSLKGKIDHLEMFLEDDVNTPFPDGRHYSTAEYYDWYYGFSTNCRKQISHAAAQACFTEYRPEDQNFHHYVVSLGTYYVRDPKTGLFSIKMQGRSARSLIGEGGVVDHGFATAYSARNYDL